MAIKSGASHWLVVPVGLFLSALAVFVVVPLVVDLIIQGALKLGEPNRSLPTLVLDLILSTSVLTLSLYVIASWSRKPKVVSTSLVALLLLAAVAALVFTPGADLPAWYQLASCLSVLLAWLVSGILFNRATKGAGQSGTAS